LTGQAGSNIRRPAKSFDLTRRIDMNWDIVEGKWNEYKGKAQAQWGKLTNDDLDVIEGRRDELAGKIQARYGKTRNDAEREIDNWLGSN
jgi:uncharacterized protein YjbJ (UPF0337 family)